MSTAVPPPHDPAETGAWPTARDGETYVAGPAVAEERRRRGRAGSHLTSTVLCLLLVPIALVLLDFSVSRGWGAGARAGTSLVGGESVPLEAWIPMAVAAALLLGVTWLGRASGLGPLLAGLVWGALPSVAFALVPATSAERIRDLPDLYDDFGVGFLDSTQVLPVLGALLVGAGLAGRWRARKEVVAAEAV